MSPTNHDRNLKMELLVQGFFHFSFPQVVHTFVSYHHDAFL